MPQLAYRLQNRPSAEWLLVLVQVESSEKSPAHRVESKFPQELLVSDLPCSSTGS